MEESDDLKNHLFGFFEAVDKLQSMDVEINGDLLSIMLLYSLPSTYENFRCAIESRDDLLATASLKIKIVEEYHAGQKDGGNGNGAMFAKANPNSLHGGSRTGQPRDEKLSSQRKPKPAYKCGYCHRKGHKASDCFNNNSSFFVDGSASKSEEMWCIDSGCTAHICNNIEAFSTVRETGSNLKLANHASTKVQGTGDVVIHTARNASNTVTLTNTLYVPDVRANLISVTKIVDKGNAVTFTKSGAVVKDSSRNTKITASRVEDLFFIQGKSVLRSHKM